MPANTGQKQDTRFKPGQSGNPAGKAKGTRHRATLALEALLDGEGGAITRKAVELALEGDTVALRLCLDRILPVRKDRPIQFELPAIQSAGDSHEGDNRHPGRRRPGRLDAIRGRRAGEARGRSCEGYRSDRLP